MCPGARTAGLGGPCGRMNRKKIRHSEMAALITMRRVICRFAMAGRWRREGGRRWCRQASEPSGAWDEGWTGSALARAKIKIQLESRRNSCRRGDLSSKKSPFHVSGSRKGGLVMTGLFFLYNTRTSSYLSLFLFICSIMPTVATPSSRRSDQRLVESLLISLPCHFTISDPPRVYPGEGLGETQRVRVTCMNKKSPDR